ncbi:MAG TPA: MFS transporter [Rectinemataceae bacterium]|nr:MFS transporter [Rectinemataceae bacterium]
MDQRESSRALALMIVVVGLLNADQNLINSNLGMIEAEFGVNDAAIGLMSGLFTILGAAVSLAAGYLSDKGSRKRLFLISVLLSEVPCLLTAFSATWGQFFLFRILTGFGVGASFPIIFSMLGDMYGEKRRASAVAWMTTVMGIGQILGQVVSGYLSPAIGWRPPFVVVSLPTLLALGLFAALVKEPQRGAAESSIESLVASGLAYPRTIRVSDYLRLFTTKTNLLLFIQGILGTIPWGAIPLFLVKFLNENKGLSEAGANTAFLLFAAGNIVGTILGGLAGGAVFRRAARSLPRFCAWTTVLGTGITVYLFAFVPSGNLPVTLLLGFLAAFFVSMTGPNMRTMLLDVNVPENRGAIFSVFNLTDSLGTGLGKFVGGLLSVSFGLGVAITSSAAFWIPCAVVLWIAGVFFAKDIAAVHAAMENVAADMRQRDGAGHVARPAATP